VEYWWRAAVLADLDRGYAMSIGLRMANLLCCHSKTEGDEVWFIKEQTTLKPGSTLLPKAKMAVDKKWSSARKPHFHMLYEVALVFFEIIPFVAPIYRWVSYFVHKRLTRDTHKWLTNRMLVEKARGENEDANGDDANPTREKPKAGDDKTKKPSGDGNDADIVFVWFNAWLYDDTDNMWVGLVQELYEAAEQHYGEDYAFAKRRAGLYRTVLSVLTVIALLAWLLTWFISQFDLDSFSMKETSTLLKNAKALSTVFGTLIAIAVSFSSAIAFSKQESRRSQQLGRDASGKDFRKLGYAKQIKEEIEELTSVLKNPELIKTMWDLLLPDWIPIPLRKLLLRLLKKPRVGKHQKCRFIIFVDDLDRCIPEKAVEVLRSLVLLTEEAPFVIFLAIDARVIVSAIEINHNDFFRDAGINGYEYLDKVVQLPFAIPLISPSQRRNLVTGYLLGGQVGVVYPLVCFLHRIFVLFCNILTKHFQPPKQRPSKPNVKLCPGRETEGIEVRWDSAEMESVLTGGVTMEVGVDTPDMASPKRGAHGIVEDPVNEDPLIRVGQLASGTHYEVRLRLRNEYGTGEWSEAATTTTTATVGWYGIFPCGINSSLFFPQNGNTPLDQMEKYQAEAEKRNGGLGDMLDMMESVIGVLR
jgi:hypothetical protein